ncbi:MAG: helix-turn-helix domain-containing protein [Verrucomicrobiota bacterium]
MTSTEPTRWSFPDGELLTKQEAAAALTIKIRTLDDWRANKLLPFIEKGRYIRFRKSDIEAFLASHTVQPRAAAAYRPRSRKSTLAA